MEIAPNRPKEINIFKDWFKRSVTEKPRLAGQEEKLGYKKRTTRVNLNSGHKIIDYRRKYIKDLGTITNSRILKFV
jgi:hypothetical protein